MQLKSLFQGWTRVAGFLLMGGALAWMLKLSVIISTNGRIIETGPAAFFMKMGLLLLAIGSTGIGHRLGRKANLWLRTLAILLSPIVVFGSLLLFGMITHPLFNNSSIWYAQQEAPIAIAVMVYLTTGFVLYRSYRPAMKTI